MSSEVSLINIIKFLYQDVLDNENDYDDEYDGDIIGDDAEVEENIDDNDIKTEDITLSDDDENLFVFIRDNKEDIIFNFLCEKLYISQQNDTFFNIELLNNSNLTKIWIQKVQDYFDEEEEIPFEIQGDLIIADKETSFFNYEIDFEINSVEDINKKDAEINNIIEKFNKTLDSDDDNLFQVI